jgi:hypothetical protein
MTTVYDAAHDRLLLFGGWTGQEFKNDVWELTLAGTPAWNEIHPSGTPPSPRRHYAGVWDPAENRLVITGGVGTTGYLADTWTLQFDAQGNAQWLEQHPRGPAPTPRNGHRAALDAANNRMLVFGGYDDAYRNDFWELDLTGKMKWQELRSGLHDGEPDPVMLPTFIADPVNSRFILLGGVDIGDAKDAVWSFSFNANNGAAVPPAVPRPMPAPAVPAHVSALDPRGLAEPVHRSDRRGILAAGEHAGRDLPTRLPDAGSRAGASARWGGGPRRGADDGPGPDARDLPGAADERDNCPQFEGGRRRRRPSLTPDLCRP